MELSIEVTRDELIQAAQNLIYDLVLDKDTEADEEAIAVIIKEHLESAIEERLSNPDQYLKPNEWSQVSS